MFEHCSNHQNTLHLKYSYEAFAQKAPLSLCFGVVHNLNFLLEKHMRFVAWIIYSETSEYVGGPFIRVLMPI